MEEKRIEVTENEELLKEEVDIYELPDCDIVRKKCENDCIGGGAFLNTTKYYIQKYGRLFEKTKSSSLSLIYR